MRYSFDRFELDPGLHRLQDADGHEIALRPQAFKVLEYLVSRAPSVVSKDDLLKGVWGHNALSVSGVSQAIREIRRALCDDAAQPRIIATRHGCGYQVVTPVVKSTESSESPEAADAELSASLALQREPSSPLGTMCVFGLVLVGIVAGLYWFRPVNGAFVLSQDEMRTARADPVGYSVPADADANAAFLAAERLRREMDWVRAIEKYTESVELDPGSSAALLGLIDAYLRAGYETRARDLISHPTLQLGNLSRRDRLEVRAVLARLSGNWEEVVNCMRSLAEFFPSRMEYRFGLFEALLASAPPDRARKVLERIESALPADNPGARYFLALHALNEREDQPGEALAAAQMAVEAAESEGLNAMSAHAELALGRSLASIDRLARSREALQRAAQAMRSAYHEFGHAEALLELAWLDLRQNRLDGIRTQIERPCAIHRGIGSTLGHARCAGIEGEYLMVLGDSDGARRLLDQAAANFEHAGNLIQAGHAFLALGRLELKARDLDRARDSLARAENLFDQVGDRSGYAWGRQLSGELLHLEGSSVEARIAHGSAYVVFRAIGDRRGEAAAARGMATGFVTERMHDRASALYDEAIAIYRDTDDPFSLAGTLFDAGVLAQQSGRLQAAEQFLAEAAEIHSTNENEGEAILAFAELSLIYIEQARVDAARAALARAESLEPSDAGHKAILKSVAGYLALLECDRAGAELLFAGAGALREALDDVSGGFQTRLDHARLFLERGMPAEAETAARHIVERIDETDSRQLVAEAFVVLTDALVSQGSTNAARMELVRMERLGLVRESVKVDLAYQILLGKLDMVSEPSDHLRAVRNRANAAGYRLLTMETDVALASKLLGRGQTSEGSKLATEVMESARESGVLHMAERAMQLKSPVSEELVVVPD
ncbi:MAG: winged helix-turn-helix domain-containing protein [Wenzhouxiangellaceae bacterium]